MIDINNNVYCKRCGKLLHDVYSKQVGFGPICLKSYKKEHNKQINLFNLYNKNNGGDKNG